jgi:hypothetical protein
LVDVAATRRAEPRALKEARLTPCFLHALPAFADLLWSPRPAVAPEELFRETEKGS